MPCRIRAARAPVRARLLKQATGRTILCLLPDPFLLSSTHPTSLKEREQRPRSICFVKFSQQMTHGRGSCGWQGETHWQCLDGKVGCSKGCGS